MVHAVVISIIDKNIQAVPFNFFFFTLPDGMLVSLSSFFFSHILTVSLDTMNVKNTVIRREWD